MSTSAISLVEQGMRFAQARAGLLAADVANSATPGFVPRDLTPAIEPGLESGGLRFAAVTQELASGGPAAGLEYAMAATAKNSVTYRALADQERAMLRELRTVAEESRR
ncbi:MAG TPA: hypothetical protein VN934_06710 [Candidatus Tumulicola sp.]|nr:hypothetical protein [Candidatus Tumulicola sp.]